MTPTQIPEHDKDYLLLSEIDANSDISQRELSNKTGVSLGSVNLLMKKMIREGLIKMEKIHANRVIYMLTPKGMAEKAEKTVRYIRHHYNAIQETKERIRRKLDQHEKQYEQIVVCLPTGELKDLVETTLAEYRRAHPNKHVITVDRMCLMEIESKPSRTIVLYLPDESANSPVLIGNTAYQTDLLF